MYSVVIACVFSNIVSYVILNEEHTDRIFLLTGTVGTTPSDKYIVSQLVNCGLNLKATVLCV